MARLFTFTLVWGAGSARDPLRLMMTRRASSASFCPPLSLCMLRALARPALRVAAPAALLRTPRAPAMAALARRGLCSAPTIEVPIPELGAESISEGGILSIAKGVGDYVAAEEMVAEIETGTGPFPSASRDPPIWLLHSLTQRMLR